jgi:very-short-patch-repair endonuclease
MEELIENLVCLVKSGLSLKEISILHNKSSSYYSNLLKHKFPHINKELKHYLIANRTQKIKNVTSKDLDLDILIELINSGLSASQVASKLQCSDVHVKKTVKANCEELYNKLLENGKMRQFNSFSGKINCKWRSNKGKTYEEIYGNRANEMREKRSKWLRENNIRKFATRISKPQAMLFSIVKNHFPQAEIEFEVKISTFKTVWLDIAIPDLMINIEYDGLYWHSDNHFKNRTTDFERDKLLELMGWKIFRIQSKQNLTETELKCEFSRLQLI